MTALVRFVEIGELTIALDGGVSIEEREDCAWDSIGLDFVACDDRSSSNIACNDTLAPETATLMQDITATHLVGPLKPVKPKLGIFN